MLGTAYHNRDCPRQARMESPQKPKAAPCVKGQQTPLSRGPTIRNKELTTAGLGRDISEACGQLFVKKFSVLLTLALHNSYIDFICA